MISLRFLMILLALLSGCGMPAQSGPGKMEEGRQRAQEYPSTRNAEKPDPSIGGTNSASSRPEAHPDATSR